MRRNWDFQTLLGRMQNDNAILENSLEISYKGKLTLIVQPSNPIPEYLNKEK